MSKTSHDDMRPEYDLSKGRPNPYPDLFVVGDKVAKIGSDYRFDGVVMAVFAKLSGQVRIVVEDDRGTLFIGNMQGYVRR